MFIPLPGIDHWNTEIFKNTYNQCHYYVLQHQGFRGLARALCFLLIIRTMFRSHQLGLKQLRRFLLKYLLISFFFAYFNLFLSFDGLFSGVITLYVRWLRHIEFHVNSLIKHAHYLFSPLCAFYQLYL